MYAILVRFPSDVSISTASFIRSGGMILIISTIKREVAPSMKYFLYFFIKTLYIKFSLKNEEKDIVTFRFSYFLLIIQEGCGFRQMIICMYSWY